MQVFSKSKDQKGLRNKHLNSGREWLLGYILLLLRQMGVTVCGVDISSNDEEEMKKESKRREDVRRSSSRSADEVSGKTRRFAEPRRCLGITSVSHLFVISFRLQHRRSIYAPFDCSQSLR